MPTPFCQQTGRPHSEYTGLLETCPHCKDVIPKLVQHTEIHSSGPQVTPSSNPYEVINLDDESPAMSTALPRFSTFRNNAQQVESHRQTAIRNVPKHNKRAILNAGAKSYTLQNKTLKIVPIPENVKICIVKGIMDTPRSFSILGLSYLYFFLT